MKRGMKAWKRMMYPCQMPFCTSGPTIWQGFGFELEYTSGKLLDKFLGGKERKADPHSS